MATSFEQPQTDRTVRIFDQFYNVDIGVSADAYEVVYSYFQSVTNNNNTAKNFAYSLFIVSSLTKINIMELLENVKGTNNRLELDATMAYYLNGIKTKTTMYGVSVLPSPNQQVQRNILV